MRFSVLAALGLVACGPAQRGEVLDGPAADAPVGTDGSEQPSSRVYAHSGTTLFQINSQSLQEVTIGTMSGLGTQSLTDLAIDKDDHMVGVTLDKLFSIDPSTGVATKLADLSSGFTSLSYVPDPADDTKDILISADDQGDVYRVDIVGTTATATKIGSYGTVSLGKVISSGDIIGVRGFGIYATVDVGTEPNDYLARIDPANGWKATVLGTSTGFNNIFGLGFWGGKVYGFVDIKTAPKGGKVVLIDANTGAGSELGTGTVEWYGAGVATDAPIIL